MVAQERQRIASIDALRGFDFVWILGLDGVARALAAAWPNALTETLGHQFRHFPTGVTFYDLVMPIFIFLSACTFPFWQASRERRGWTRGRIALDVLRRFAVLTLVGCWLARYLSFDFAHVSYAPLFTIIGFAWATAGLSRLYCGRFWPLPGLAVFAASLAVFAVWPNAKELFDQWLTPWAPILRPGNPTYAWRGTIVLFAAVPTGFLGCWAGEILASPGRTDLRKCGVLALVALPMLAAGFLLCRLMGPAMKPSWNPQFALVSGAFALLFLALFHWLCEVKKIRRGVFAFTVIGTNALTIYVLKSVVPIREIARKYFTSGIDSLLPEVWHPVVDSFATFLICFGICLFLYRKKIFIRV